MRQAGIIAAPGIIALEVMTKRLHEDHQTALRLRDGLSEFGIACWDTETNIVVADFSSIGLSSYKAIEQMQSVGILAGPRSDTLVRFVTHRHVNATDIEEAIQRLHSLFGNKK